MSEIFVLVLLNDDDSIAKVISAHLTQQTAKNAEVFYWRYVRVAHSDERTEIIAVDVEP